MIYKALIPQPAVKLSLLAAIECFFNLPNIPCVTITKIRRNNNPASTALECTSTST